MPAYEHLFADGDPRGEALVDYLMTLGRDEPPVVHATLRGSANDAQLEAIRAPSDAAAPNRPIAPRVNVP
jgi:hypothetical protein